MKHTRIHVRYTKETANDDATVDGMSIMRMKWKKQERARGSGISSENEGYENERENGMYAHKIQHRK